MQFCIIDCDNAVAWREYPFSRMFEERLHISGDRWTVIKVDDGAPVPTDISQYSGIVITGSRHNCRDKEQLPWFEPLCELIRRVFEDGYPQLYGGCFGCQVIAEALGGKVDFNPHGGFILKAELLKQVSPVPAILGISDAGYNDLLVLESHGDCVRQLPQMSILLARSETCENELFSAGKELPHNILACQSHPEFDLDYCILQRIWPSVVSRNRITEYEQQEFGKTLSVYSREQGADDLIRIITEFLHRS